MSQAFGDYVACPAIQEQLNTQFLTNPQTQTWPNGALKLIASDLNSDGTLQRVISENGKYRTVELTFQPRFTDESSDDATINCVGGEEYGNTSATYTIDPTLGKSRPFSITPAQMAATCQNDNAWIARQVQAHLTAIEHDINQALATFIAANLGDFYDSSVTSKDTNTRTTTDAYNTDLIGDVAYEYEAIQWKGQPFLIGDQELSKYMRATQAGCCALQGVDLGEFAMQNPLIFLRDPDVFAALTGTQPFVVIGPGAIQMLQYREFENPVMMFDTPQLKQGVIVNPESGIEYDYLAKYDCGKWNFQIKLAFKFVTIPQDSFRSDDPLEGTNGILKFNIVNP